MPMYRAVVKDKETKKRVVVKSEYKTKADFIKDLRRNGYSVYPQNVDKIK